MPPQLKKHRGSPGVFFYLFTIDKWFRRKTVMRFIKMHGAGNDYVYVDTREETVDDPGKLAVRISDRHFGVGSDGLILIMPSDRADVRMRMFNADGSEAEMCGNGVRCVAKYAVDSGIAEGPDLAVETGRGVLQLKTFSGAEGKVNRVRVGMGEPILSPDKIPFRPDSPADTPALDQIITVQGRDGAVTLKGTPVSMGNPHFVVFVDDVEHYPVHEIGPLVEQHPFFPNRTNVEFVQRLNCGGVRIRTWERGAGETLACGTGASAVGVVMHLLHGHTGPLDAALRGGNLVLEWNGSGSVMMTGPAEEVFRGDYPL